MIKGLLIQPDNVYMIRRKDRNPYFFLYDCIETDQLMEYVLWTPNKFKAREFYTEETVETFMFSKLANRPCEIIMVK